MSDRRLHQRGQTMTLMLPPVGMLLGLAVSGFLWPAGITAGLIAAVYFVNRFRAVLKRWAFILGAILGIAVLLFVVALLHHIIKTVIKWIIDPVVYQNGSASAEKSRQEKMARPWIEWIKSHLSDIILYEILLRGLPLLAGLVIWLAFGFFLGSSV